MLSRLDEHGDPIWPDMDLVRLAIPRRVYTQSHIDYVAECVAALYRVRHEIPGLRMIDARTALSHFTAAFAIV